MGYSFRLTARVLLYAPSHRQDSTYHGLCYTSRGALAGTRNSSMGPPHEGSIRRPMEIRDRYRDHIPVYTDGSRDGNVACATAFPSNTVISMRLPDSASIFTAEVWAIIEALEQIKDSIASKYIVFTDSLSCLQALHHIKLEHPLIGMVIRKCLFKFCQKRHCFLLGTQR